MVDRLLAAWIDASIAATAISGLVVLAMVQCRQPARRIGWARAGLLASLMIVPLATLNPMPPIDLGRLIRMVVPARWDDPGPMCRFPADGDAAHSGLLDLDATSSELPGPATPVRPAWVGPLGTTILVVYALGVAIGVGWIVMGFCGVALVVRRAVAPSKRSLELYATLPSGPFRGRPRLLVSGRMASPALVGVFRPVVLLPEPIEERGTWDGLRLSLTHELAHAEAGDHLFRPLANLVQAIWFFLPPVWWIRDQMTMDQEFLADRRAVAGFGDSSDYASALLDLSASRQAPAPRAGQGATTGAASGVASALFQRVTMLLKCPFAIENHPPLWWRRSAAATIAVATLAASCLSFRGLAMTSAASQAAPVPPARSFRIPSLVITPSGAQDQPFDLRFRLPAAFTLELEVMADPGELLDIQILQHRLGPPPGGDPAPEVYRLWHKVTIRRRESRESVEVDGRVLEEFSENFRPAIWLTIKPLSNQTTRVRDLDLSW